LRGSDAASLVDDDDAAAAAWSVALATTLASVLTGEVNQLNSGLNKEANNHDGVVDDDAGAAGVAEVATPLQQVREANVGVVPTRNTGANVIA
jgi:hypothetical protein